MCSRFEQAGQAIRPTDFATVLLAAGEARLRWGLAVSWDKRPLINARAETLASRPTFRALLGRRCVVPAGAWWEWQGKRRFRLGLEDGTEMGFAGLFDGDAFVVVTRPAHPALADIHDRMPAVLSENGRQAWLNQDPADAVLTEPDLTYAGIPDGDDRQGELF